MTDHTINRISLVAFCIALLSVAMLYQEQIYPWSLYADAGASLLLGCAYFARRFLQTQVRFNLVIAAGTLSGLVAAMYNPLAADSMLVLTSTIALALTNWDGAKALLVPALSVCAFTLMTVLVALDVIQIQPGALRSPDSLGYWVISLACLLLIIVVLWLSIHELKKRLQAQIGQLQQMNQQLFDSAYLDVVTGLPNRQYFQQEVEKAMQQRASFRIFTLKMTGMNLVKALHGLPKCDEGLRRMRDILQQYIVKDSFVARIDAEQFVLLSDTVAESDYLPIFQQFNQLTRQDTQLQHLGLSYAMATTLWPQDATDFIGLMRNLDLTLQDSEQSKGELRAFSATQLQQLTARNALRDVVQNALAEGLFYPVYQSKVRCSNTGVVGFEGLARLRHQEQMISPAEFIPLLHAEGWMEQFGQCMLAAIIRDIPALTRQYGPDIKVAANVSPPMFLSVDFVPFVQACLTQNNVDAKNLVIEITEEVFATNVGRIIQSCRELQQLGVHVSLDDFGTGFSSLSYLQQIQFDEIKIDRSFVRDILSNPKGQVLLASMCQLVNNLNCKVVIEGIEEAAQFELVRQLADEIQGFYFSRPTPLQQLVNS